MKKAILTTALLAFMAIGAKADEGMWLLPLLQQMNSNVMTDLGCRISADDIYSINHSSLKDAIVQFGGGCTGEMISNEGLLVTNHHCGYSSIQKLSSPEHNYLEDGYWAMSKGEELPVPGLTVTFLVSMTDVTDMVNGENGKEKREEIIRQAELSNPNCDVEVQSFYNDNVFYLMIYKVYKDVRFVGAPPASMGKFGGETDNWMWPRHTCDFSMFRVYAGKDNNPAEYSEDNVPYQPKQALKVSLKGIKEGDFAMIIGYPGRTQRFQTADQLESMMEGYDIAVKARTVRQRVMKEGMESDPEIRLKYANKYASSSNGWKKWQAEAKSFKDLNIIGREKQKESDFMDWVGKDNARKAKYGNALSEISEAVDSTRQPNKDYRLLIESAYTVGPVSVAGNFIRTYVEKMKKEGPIDTAAVVNEAVQSAKKVFKDYDVPLEKKLAKTMLKYYRDNARKENYLEGLGEDFATMDIDSYVDNIFANSAFATKENLEKFFSQPFDHSKTVADPGMQLYTSVIEKISDMYPAMQSKRGQLRKGSKDFTEGLMEWKKGEASYPDANFTMRLTYGTVLPYSPKDGVSYWYYTTLKGVMEKENPNNYEFKVPSKLKELYNAKNYGIYADQKGDLPVNFLTNCDITGGNSGSPVLDADGNLIGLAFDGNSEAMSSDVMFEPELQRCICVDIRYVLFSMDKVGGAGYLLKEMTLTK